MAFASDGTLYGVDAFNKRLITIDLTSETVTTVSSLPDRYVGLAVAPDDTLFVSYSPTHTLIQYDRSGNELSRMDYISSTSIMGLEFAVVPEPISSILFVTGGALLVGRRRIRRKS